MCVAEPADRAIFTAYFEDRMQKLNKTRKKCIYLFLSRWYKKYRRICFIIYCISTVNTQHMQRPDVLVQLGYIWRHVSAVNRCTLTMLFFVGLRMAV